MNEIDKGFEQVAAIIENARANAFRKVNEELKETGEIAIFRKTNRSTRCITNV